MRLGDALGRLRHKHPVVRIELGASGLHDLRTLGQSVWLDCCHPGTLLGSQLRPLIRGGISGLDAHLVDLATAYADDDTYRKPLTKLRSSGATGEQIYERLCIEDFRHAADCLARTYHSGGRDGYVCIELPPALAHDVEGTVSVASHLWSVIGRPNVMIKVPATEAGLIAMRRLIAAGINVNASLIFGARRCRDVSEAYVAGLEDRVEDGLPLEGVASVASVEVSLIDQAVNRHLDSIQQPTRSARAHALRNRAGIALAQFIYQRYKGVIASPRWQVLAARHAKTQRLLWATADLGTNGMGYVTALIGRDTVAAMSPSTVSAYLDRGAAAPTLERNLHEVITVFGELQALGISLDRVSAQLERERIDATQARAHAALIRLAGGLAASGHRHRGESLTEQSPSPR